MSATSTDLRAPFSRLLMVALAIGLASPAVAQEVPCESVGDFPCAYQMEAVKVDRVPNSYHFQARISQAKMPVGSALFQQIVVKVVRGTEILCIEEFQNVQVQYSVLNLKIGANLSCDLQHVIAESDALAFQVCINGLENCLKPVELGTTPFAVKSSYAKIAQNAHHANKAGQASYAHRVTADKDLYVRKKLGTGYFDFYSAPASLVYPYGGSETPLYANSSDYVNWENTGFIQWTPIRDTGAKSIHITARSHATQRPTPLDNLVLHARANTAYGTMLVDPPQAPAAGHTLRVTKGGADVTGNSRVDGTLLISSATTVQSGGIHVTGNSDISGQVDINGAVNIANGNVTLTSGNHQTLQGGALTVQGTGGDSVVIDNDSAVFNNGAGATTHITGPGVIDGLNVLNGGVHVQGNSDVNGALSLATGPLTLVGGANAVLQGGSVTVQADGGAQSTFSGTTLNLTAGDQSATLTAQGLVAANLTTNGTSSITGTATFDNGALQTSTASGETVIPAGKKLRIDGELVGTGDIAIGIDGDSCETVTSTLTTSGDDAECQVALADQAVFPIQCPDTSINCTQQNSCYNPDYYNGPFATWYAFTSSMCSAYGWVHPYFCDGTLFTTDPAVSLNLLKAVNNGSWPGFSMNSSYGPGTTIPAYVEECVDLLFTEFCTDVPNPSYDAAMGTLYSNWPGMVSGANPFYSNSSLHIPTCAACATSLTDFTNMLVVPQVSDGQSMAACTNGSPSTLTGSCSCQAQAAAAGVPPWTPGYCPSCVRIYEYSCGCKADASQCTAFLADTTVQSGADSNLSQGGTQCSDMTSTGCLNYVAASSYMTRCRGTECRMCEPGTMLASSLGGEMKCCKAKLYLSAE